MPDDYPSVHTKGGKHFITFRFPRFSNSMSYDPVLDTDYGTPSAAEVDNSAFSFHGANMMWPAFLVCAIYLSDLLW